jgi:hypothetical protein
MASTLRSRWGSFGRIGDNGVMGFNPHRQYKRKGASDYLLVAAAVVVALLLVIWAFMG